MLGCFPKKPIVHTCIKSSIKLILKTYILAVIPMLINVRSQMWYPTNQIPMWKHSYVGKSTGQVC